MEIPDRDEVEAALVEYETDVSPESQSFSMHLFDCLRQSDIFWEMVKRAGEKPEESCAVAIQAGIEAGYRLRKLHEEKPRTSQSGNDQRRERADRETGMPGMP